MMQINFGGRSMGKSWQTKLFYEKCRQEGFRVVSSFLRSGIPEVTMEHPETRKRILFCGKTVYDLVTAEAYKQQWALEGPR